MAKKGKVTDEEVQAGAGQAAGEMPVSPDADAPETEAVVADRDRAGAAEGSAEPENGADAADQRGAETAMGEDAGEDRGRGADAAEGETERPEAAADAAALAGESGEGVTDGTENLLFAVEGGEGAAESADAETGGAEEHGETLDDGGLFDVSSAGGDAGNSGSAAGSDGVQDDGLAAAGDGSADGAALGDEDLTESMEDRALTAAKDVVFVVLEYLDLGQRLAGQDVERLEAIAGYRGSGGPAAIAAFVRQVGPERATVEVIASQLKILGIIDEVVLTPVERLLVTVFVSTLTAVDAFEAEEQAMADEAERQARALEAQARARPLPIEDTILEPVSGPLEMW